MDKYEAALEFAVAAIRFNDAADDVAANPPPTAGVSRVVSAAADTLAAGLAFQLRETALHCNTAVSAIVSAD